MMRSVLNAKIVQVRNDCSLLLQEDLLKSNDCIAVEMEAYALLKVASLLRIRVLGIMKGISDVGQERLAKKDPASEHNLKELARFQIDPNGNEVTHTQLRQKYREHAATNAARVMYELIVEWSNEETD